MHSGTLYVDNATQRVGIGTTSPATELDVNGIIKGEDIQLGVTGNPGTIYFYKDGNPLGEYIYWHDTDQEFVVSDDIYAVGSVRGTILKGNQIRLGDSEGHRYIYFYDGGSPTGQAIYWDNSADRFVVSDDIYGLGEIRGATLEGDQIRLGSSEGSHIIYFYNDGEPTGEWIAWSDAADWFHMTNDVYINGTVYVPHITRYYSIPACAWQPLNSSYDYFSGWDRTYTNTPGLTYWFAPVNLPHGADINELMVWVYDTSESDIYIELRCHYGESDTLMGNLYSQGVCGWVQEVDDTIDWGLVDNNRAYYVHARLNSGNDTHRLGQVRITYTVNEALP